MRAFWTAEDLAVWIGLALPSLLLGGLIARFIPVSKPLQAMFGQFLFFLIWFILLKLLLQLKYSERFWWALGWVVPDKGLWLCLAMGPFLAVGLNLLAQWMKAPIVDPPFKDVLFDRRSRYLFAAASVIAAPLCEELAFRGFLMPLIAKWLGAAAGILVTGLIFGVAHGAQNGWLWQYIVLLAAAGSVFGWARWRYASTMSAMVLHSSFNLTVFLARIYG
jgi:membrane protease YdiL (CAAX protease family)